MRLKKWMIIRSHHQPTKLNVLPKTCLQIVFAAKWLVLHSSAVSPPTSSDDLCLLFCIYPSSIWSKARRAACWSASSTPGASTTARLRSTRAWCAATPAPPVWRRSGAVGHPASASAWMYSVTPLRHECKLFSWGDFRFLVCKYCTPASRQDVTSLLKITIYI